jgi:hypothetical protein
MHQGAHRVCTHTHAFTHLMESQVLLRCKIVCAFACINMFYPLQAHIKIRVCAMYTYLYTYVHIYKHMFGQGKLKSFHLRTKIILWILRAPSAFHVGLNSDIVQV